MDKKLYDMMDWAGIEELVYSEASNPHGMLGPHVTEEGMLVQAFIPTAESVTVKAASKKYPSSDSAQDTDRVYPDGFL